MADPKAIYIASISGGKCLENTQQEKKECRLRKWNKSAAQQWLVEPSENDPNTVAFKSVLNRQYLVALEPSKRNGGKIGVSVERQYWTLEPGRGPEWFHVKSNSSFGGGKAGYLNDEWGRLKDDNKIQTYQFEEGNPGFNTFYFPAAQVADTQTFQAPDGASAAAGAGNDQAEKKKELDEKEQELKERESNAKKSKEANDAKAKELEDKEVALAKRQQELSQQQDKSNSEAASKDAEKSKALEEREATLSKTEEAPSRKEKGGNVQAASTADGSAGRTKELEEREAAVKEKEEELQRREKNLTSAAESIPEKKPDASEAQNNQTTSQETASNGQQSETGDPHELCRVQRENDMLKMRVKIGELEAKLRDRPTCTHKVKRPPRKIDHKVQGYVYV